MGFLVLQIRTDSQICKGKCVKPTTGCVAGCWRGPMEWGLVASSACKKRKKMPEKIEK